MLDCTSNKIRSKLEPFAAMSFTSEVTFCCSTMFNTGSTLWRFMRAVHNPQPGLYFSRTRSLQGRLGIYRNLHELSLHTYYMEGVNETLVSEPTSANLLYPSNVSVHAKVKKY